ncbi:D-2-hydroxyacid dehydrogenase [Savagea sp. SN6]|uniref:D-2-hydroxyacid dehydrogenase n=1 Tax=Savagea serpentis TaxID=2785297 RepID=A0A8J7GEL9_9BACL|nr:D-2-hydroxyacid dehydrogenase [Savagea serpentis]MBF4502206.1 D-2-hydroxyacid dehydrogenase [Savagea serpentis]
MDILVTVPLKEHIREDLAQTFPTVTFHYEEAEHEWLEKSEVLVTYGNDVTESVVDRAKNLKWLMVASAGVDNFPLEKIAERKWLVTNAKGIHKIPMAESMLAHILALSKGFPQIYDNERQKVWDRRVPQIEISGQKALILGPGTIGSEVGRLLQAFGVHTIGYNRSGKPSLNMDEMIQPDQLMDTLPKVDSVISILPSTPETRYLWQLEHFEAMKESAIFLNFGRGDFVKEEVVLEALHKKLVRHVVLDVFEKEPLREDSELWTMTNCTVSPHISSLSNQYIPRSIDIFKENLKRYLDEEKEYVNEVDILRGY